MINLQVRPSTKDGLVVVAEVDVVAVGVEIAA